MIGGNGGVVRVYVNVCASGESDRALLNGWCFGPRSMSRRRRSMDARIRHFRTLFFARLLLHAHRRRGLFDYFR